MWKKLFYKSVEEPTVGLHTYRLGLPQIKIDLSAYWLLAGIRIVLTLIPQTGYIHPDEYFQSMEVITGDIFDVESARPWEFNSTFPIRSIVLPYLSVGLPIGVLKVLAPLLNLWFDVRINTPYMLLVLPRLVSCLLSFVCDYSLYKISYAYGQSYKARLLTFASSYVVLVYGTRTFSNSTEMVLMSMLLYMVADCMKHTDQVVFQDDYLLTLYNATGDNPVERVKIRKLRNALPNHSLRRCVEIAWITVAGIFNRPTFIAFAFPPLFFWLQRGLGSKTVGLAHFHLRFLVLILNGLPVAFLFLIIDSFYYGYITMHEILVLKINLENFVVAPLNFFKYNMKSANLAKHGLHPRFLHLMVNMPLLYNVLALLGLLTCVRLIYRSIVGKLSDLPRIQSISGLMTASVVIPVAALSIFPHQEARFLIPVTLPLIFMLAQKVLQPSAHNSTTNLQKQKSFNYLLAIWYICNIVCTLFFGFLHQGGVYPLTNFLSTEIQTKPKFTAIHLVTSYTYSLPMSLLQLKNTKRPHINKKTGQRYRLAKEFYSYELGSADLDYVVLKLETLLEACEKKLAAIKMGYRLYLAIPGSLTSRLTDLVRNSSFSYTTLHVYYPHISTEALPNLYCKQSSVGTTDVESFSYLSNCVQPFGLSLIQIQKFKR